MGRRLVVATTTNQLTESFTSISQVAVAGAALTGLDPVEELLKAQSHSIVSRVNRAYRYGRDDYFHRLPNGSFETNVGIRTALSDYLATNIHADAELIEFELGIIDPHYLATEFLYPLGWTPNDDEIDPTGIAWMPNKVPHYYRGATWVGAPSAKTVQLEFEFVIPSGGQNPTPVTGKVYRQYTSPTVLDMTRQYFQIIYLLQGSYYTTFLDGDTDLGAYSDTQFNYENPFLPIIAFRRNDEDLTDPSLHGTQEYQTTQRLCRHLGIDYQSLSEQIHENDQIQADTNKKGVDQVTLMFGIKLSTTDDLCIDYLFRFFDELRLNDTYTQADYDAYVSQPPAAFAQGFFPPQNRFTIRDSGYAMALAWYYSNSTIHQGSIGNGAIGTVQSLYTQDDEFALRKQINASQYREITFYGLTHENTAFRGATVVTRLSDVGSDHDNFIVPLNFNLSKQFPLRQREQLYHASFHLVYNAYEFIKIAWYQTALFRFALIVVAAVISVVTLNPYIASGTLTATTVALKVLEMYLIGLILEQAADVLVDFLGDDSVFGSLVLVVVAAYLMLRGDQRNAMVLMDLSTNMQAQVSEEIQTELIQLTDAYSERMDEIQRLLKEYQTSVDSSLDLNTLLYHQPLFFPNETAQQFYQRMKSSKTLPRLFREQIRWLKAELKRLPTTDQTLGEIYG